MKSGIFTTELWLSVAVLAVGGSLAAFSEASDSVIMSILGFGGLKAAAYTAGRSYIKKGNGGTPK